MTSSLLPWLAGLALSAAVLAAVLVGHGRMRRRLAACRAELAASAAAANAATRLLRLAAHDLREAGLALRGHADRLGSSGGAHAAALAMLSARLRLMADEVQEQAGTAPDAPTLREELIDPAEAVAAALAATALTLEPGRRQWRVAAAPDTAGLRVWADRRALRHILGRVLADAACNTGQDDSIDVAILRDPEGLCLVVEDEGKGLASPEPGTAAVQESRGIGLRLAMARSLMLAHGGRLEVEAAARVGTRIRLLFPAARLRDAAGRQVAADAGCPPAMRAAAQAA